MLEAAEGSTYGQIEGDGGAYSPEQEDREAVTNAEQPIHTTGVEQRLEPIVR